MDRYIADGSKGRTETARPTAPMDGHRARPEPTPWMAFCSVGGFAAVLTHWKEPDPAPAGGL
ncbi:hypothetical protein RC1_2687 [Rhodospirillum centenum SW]|uniref:Uncharacterized protein n=1 Tax=Rhodospirillum centenum (strain ATCC 51521 / SW) TaxID=414684 RepID=B6IUY0_RHOCS|nr:hypothetical protein RC1_2687 [Rhodospirillum centenum SW]